MTRCNTIEEIPSLVLNWEGSYVVPLTHEIYNNEGIKLGSRYLKYMSGFIIYTCRLLFFVLLYYEKTTNIVTFVASNWTWTMY